MFLKNNHEYFMKLALNEAISAYDEKEVPVGAVIVYKDKIIAKAHNQVELLNDPTAHAEMIAITQASDALGSWRLLDTTMYVTLEPCPMCAGAIQLARIPHLVYATDDPKKGACGSLLNLVEDKRFNHIVEVEKGILGQDSKDLLEQFFRKLRKK